MKVAFFSVLLAVTLLFIIQQSHAETFRWIDESGKIRIGIKPVNEEKNSHTETKKLPQAIATPQTTPIPTFVKPKIITPIKIPAQIHSPKPHQKNNVRKSTPTREKTLATKPAIKKNTSIQKKSKEIIPVKKQTIEKKSTAERNAEMCDIFTDYVHDHEEKVRNCSVNLCDIYKRALTRYKKKQKSYCK